MAAARRTGVGAEGSSGTIALELVDADDRPTGVTTSVPFAVEIQPVAQQMAMTALAAKDATSRMRVGSIETRSPAGEVAEVGRTARSTSRRPTRRCQRPNWLARHRQVASSVEIASAGSSTNTASRRENRICAPHNVSSIGGRVGWGRLVLVVAKV